MAVAMSMPDSYFADVFFAPILKDDIFILARPCWEYLLNEMYPDLLDDYYWLFYHDIKKKKIFFFLEHINNCSKHGKQKKNPKQLELF